MRGLSRVIKLAPVDFKNVRRDALLAWTPILPLAIAPLIRWGVPPVAEYLQREAALDITGWYPLFMSGFAVMMPGVIGTVVGFLLIDERDDGVFSALLVTPVPESAYLAYRLCLPLLAGYVMTLITYPIAGLTPLSQLDLAAAALLGAFGAPFMALALACFADNKVTGFAIMKVLNAVQILPLVAYFVSERWQLVIGLWPTYWPMKIVWLAAAGRPYAVHLIIGLVVNFLAVGLLLKRFRKIAHR